MQWIVKRRYLFIGILVLLVIIGAIFTTYAIRVWSSPENTEFDTTIGNIAGVKFSNGDNVNVTDLGPVFDYHDGANVEFFVFNMRIGEKTIKLQIWDTCGQEIYRSLITSFYKNSSLAIIVYAIDE